MKLTLLLCGHLEERQVNKGERHLQNHFSLFFFWLKLWDNINTVKLSYKIHGLWGESAIFSINKVPNCFAFYRHFLISVS